MNNKQVALNWAARVYNGQDASRARTPHMFYDGDTIYSYGYHFPIACYHAAQRITLLNARTYSVTTSTHQSLVRRATEGKRVSVPDVSGQDHKANIAHLVDAVRANEKSALHTRLFLESCAERIKDALTDLHVYCEAFEQDEPHIALDERVTLRLIRARLVGA